MVPLDEIACHISHFETLLRYKADSNLRDEFSQLCNLLLTDAADRLLDGTRMQFPAQTETARREKSLRFDITDELGGGERRQIGKGSAVRRKSG